MLSRVLKMHVDTGTQREGGETDNQIRRREQRTGYGVNKRDKGNVVMGEEKLS